METKTEPAGCFNCEHHFMNHQACNCPESCINGNGWKLEQPDPGKAETAEEQIRMKCHKIYEKVKESWTPDKELNENQKTAIEVMAIQFSMFRLSKDEAISELTKLAHLILSNV